MNRKKTITAISAAVMTGILLTGCGTPGAAPSADGAAPEPQPCAFFVKDMAAGEWVPIGDETESTADVLPKENLQIQPINRTDTKDFVSLKVLKTLGNGNDLYVLYQLTFPETWEIGILESDGLPKLYFDVICVSSSEYNKETTKSLLVRSHLEPYAKQRWLHYDSNARTLSCISEYNFEESYRGQKLFFLMGNLYVSGPNRDEYLPWDNSMAVSWIAEN